MLDIAAVFIVITALLAYADQRLLRLPIAIGVMVLRWCCRSRPSVSVPPSSPRPCGSGAV